MAPRPARPRASGHAQTGGRQTRHLPAFILLALAEAPAHGAGVHATLAKTMAGLKLDTPAVYRALQTLESQGEVAAKWDTTGSGPARKIYRLTPAGWGRLAAWKDDIALRLDLLTGFLRRYEALAPCPGSGTAACDD